MEAIITVVGFLGAGKTTLLKHLTKSYIEGGWNPFVILNDYENANLDAQQFLDQMGTKEIMALNGSCICCSGINELRSYINIIPERQNGITLIEANGTSDACSLMGFLGVGIHERFLPPVQVSVVDVQNWQLRGEHNELEKNQIQVSSLIVLTHLEQVTEERKSTVLADLQEVNPMAKVMTMDEIDLELLPNLDPSENKAEKLDHLKAHWSSCSVDLPRLPHQEAIYSICEELPKSILRIKGCTQIGKDDEYTFFQRTPDGTVNVRAFYGEPITGSKLLTVGPGSEPSALRTAIDNSLAAKA